MKKRIFDICIFNIDNYLESESVFYCFQYNFKLFEKYKEKNKNIDFRWHILDNKKIREIAENFNLSYTKRYLNKDEFNLDEIKFFLATQFDNYLTFPADMMILESNLYSGVFDDFLDENNQIQAYLAESNIDESIITNPNGIIKCTNRNSEFISSMLKLFSTRFIKEKFNFAFENNDDFIQERTVREVIHDRKIFDFNIVNGPKVFYISSRKLKKSCERYFESLPIELKNFKKVFICFDSYPLIWERNYCYTFNSLPKNIEDYTGISFIEEFQNGLLIDEDYYKNEVNGKITRTFIKDTIENFCGEENTIDISQYTYYITLKEYLRLLYEFNGKRKFNVYNAIDFNKARLNMSCWGNFWSDYCYENKDKPEEFIPLPYLNLDDAVQKLCW